MEHQLWKAIVAVLLALDNPQTLARFDFSDRDVVKVVLLGGDSRPPDLVGLPEEELAHPPAQAAPAVGRHDVARLRSASVVALLDALERRVISPQAPGLYWMLDGKPLVIGGCSKDRQAGYGRAAGGKAKGYKIHAIVGADGSAACWRLAPMNKDERVMAGRLVRAAPPRWRATSWATPTSTPTGCTPPARRAATCSW